MAIIKELQAIFEQKSAFERVFKKNFSDKKKEKQKDNNQSVNTPYLCLELKMVSKNVRHLYSDRLIC
jgi:hypothetical protein